MLPPFIIEQIRRREEEERRRQQEQPRLELPLDVQHPAQRPVPEEEEHDTERGVVILDLDGWMPEN
jgi:hypothetical protein